mmetsp:Transcript_3512/g.8745  ORF Transcript_3512/g.8745 Transcript_3512/m.8745 type:complete len:218 (-) Transcript_3512:124-777(-)
MLWDVSLRLLPGWTVGASCQHSWRNWSNGCSLVRIQLCDAPCELLLLKMLLWIRGHLVQITIDTCPDGCCCPTRLLWIPWLIQRAGSLHEAVHLASARWNTCGHGRDRSCWWLKLLATPLQWWRKIGRPGAHAKGARGLHDQPACSLLCPVLLNLQHRIDTDLSTNASLGGLHNEGFHRELSIGKLHGPGPLPVSFQLQHLKNRRLACRWTSWLHRN